MRYDLFSGLREGGEDVGDVGAGDPRFPYGEAAIYKNWLGAPFEERPLYHAVMGPLKEGSVTPSLPFAKRRDDRLRPDESL